VIQRRRPSGFIKPCLPLKAARPPSGRLWVHEIKHDGYRLMVRRDGARVRCFTKNGHDSADRFPAIVDAAHRLNAQSFLTTARPSSSATTSRMTSMLAAVELVPLDAAASTASSLAIIGRFGGIAKKVRLWLGDFARVCGAGTM
jgi:hypothetical protein